MMKFMTVQLENDWTSKACLEGLPGEASRLLEQCLLDRQDQSGGATILSENSFLAQTHQLFHMTVNNEGRRKHTPVTLFFLPCLVQSVIDFGRIRQSWKIQENKSNEINKSTQQLI